MIERAKAYAALERSYAHVGYELPLFERVLVVLASPHLHNLMPNPAPSVARSSRLRNHTSANKA